MEIMSLQIAQIFGKRSNKRQRQNRQQLLKISTKIAQTQKHNHQNNGEHQTNQRVQNQSNSKKQEIQQKEKRRLNPSSRKHGRGDNKNKQPGFKIRKTTTIA